MDVAAEPNPVPALWRVERRALADDAWRPLGLLGASPAGAAHALVEAALAREGGDPGDIVRLAGEAGPAAGLWVRTPRGFEDVGFLPIALRDLGGDWVEAWEGPRATASALIAAVPPPAFLRLALAGCDLAAGVPGLAPGPLTAALDQARAWVRGEAPVRRRFARRLRAAYTPAATAVHAAVWGAVHARAGDEGVAFCAAGAFYEAVRARPGGRDLPDALCEEVGRALAPVVRRHVPLAAQLLARRGWRLPW